MNLPPPTPLDFLTQVTLMLQKAGLLDDSIEVTSAGEHQAFVLDQVHDSYSDGERRTLADIGTALLLYTSWAIQIHDSECCLALWIARDPSHL